MARRFGLRSLFYITFLCSSSALALRLSLDHPDFAAAIVFVISWLTILGVVLASILFHR